MVDIPILNEKQEHKQEDIRNYKTFSMKSTRYPKVEKQFLESKTRQSEKPLCNERRLCRVAFQPIHDVVWND